MAPNSTTPLRNFPMRDIYRLQSMKEQISKIQCMTECDFMFTVVTFATQAAARSRVLPGKSGTGSLVRLPPRLWVAQSRTTV